MSFHWIISRLIHSIELEINDISMLASYFDLHLEINTEGWLRRKLYDYMGIVTKEATQRRFLMVQLKIPKTLLTATEYLYHTLPRVCSICCPPDFNMSYTKGVTSEARTAYHSRTSRCIPDFKSSSCWSVFRFLCCLLLIIVLYVPLWFMVSGLPL